MAGTRSTPEGRPRSNRLRNFTARSALIHAILLALVLGLTGFSHYRASRLPKGVIGGEGKEVALGKVPVKHEEPEEEQEAQEAKSEHRPKMVTGKHTAPFTLTVPEEMIEELAFDDADSDFLSPSELTEAGVVGAAAGESRAGVPTGFEHFTCLYPYQLRYTGGDWNPDPSALPALMREVKKRAKIPTSDRLQVVDLAKLDCGGDAMPFLFVTGHGNVLLSKKEYENLRKYLENDGFLIVDDCSGFDPAARRLIRNTFPDIPLVRISMTHRIYSSYYPLKRILGGNVRIRDHHEGVFIGGRLAVFYSGNDLACAWERRPDGKPVHPCSPGGEEQREWAYRMGVNLMVYALTGSEQ